LNGEGREVTQAPITFNKTTRATKWRTAGRHRRRRGEKKRRLREERRRVRTKTLLSLGR
jgi:hypothetical protein